MKKTWFIIIITVICLAGFNDIEAQKEANIWYFGNNAGLDFSGEYPVPIVGSKMEAREGVACISDSLGNLLFYTNGITVWNANHEVIATNLAGHKSSTMAASIVPNPVNDRQYYLFTTRITDNAPGANNSGGHPYIFDFSPSNPSGALIQDYSSNPLQPNSTEKFLSIPFGPNLVEETGIPGYWLLTHLFDSDIFNQFRLTDAIYPHATIQVGAKHDNRTDDNGANHGAIGYIKVSNQGDRIAVAVEGHKSFHLLRFNRENGQISRYMSEAMLPAGDPNNKREAIYDAYGVEFSPTGRFLYGSSKEGGTIYQWDLTNPNITETVNILRHNPEIPCGALQLAPNGKIYCAFQDQDYLGVINRPDGMGRQLSDYQEYGVRLLDNETGEGGTSSLGLPQFDMSNYVREHLGVSNNCFGDTTLLFLIADFGYSRNSTFTIIDPESGGTYAIFYTDIDHMVNWVAPAPGEYDVRVETRYKGVNLDFVERITIYNSLNVQLAENDYTRLHCGDTIKLDAGLGAFYTWNVPSIQGRRYYVT